MFTPLPSVPDHPALEREVLERWERELAERFGIASIPTMILFRDGEPSVSVIGAQPKGAIERTLGLTAV